MELTANVPWVGLQLDHLDERAVWRQTAQVESVLDELVAILVVHFITVPMALAHLRDSVNRRRLGARAELARVRAEAHGAAHVGDVLLIFHQRYDGIPALRSELAGVAVSEAHDVARKLDDGRLHTQADPEERQSGFARVADGFQHSFDSPHAEAAGNEYA